MDIYHVASLVGLAVGSSFPTMLVPFAFRRSMPASLVSGALAAMAFTLAVGMSQLRIAPTADAFVMLGTAVLLGLLFGLIAHGSWISRTPRDRGGWSSAKPDK